MTLPPQQTVYLVDGARTPFSRQLRRNSLGETVYSPQDLLHITSRALLSRYSIRPTDIDDVVMASSHEIDCTHLAEVAAQRLHCHTSLSPQTFLANEHAGLQALSYAYQAIATQGKSLVLLGGVEAINAPVVSASDELSEWLQAWKSAAGIAEKTKVFNKLHTRCFHQRAKSLNSTDALFAQQQSQAEAIASEFMVSLEAQAEYVNLSQRRLKYAQRNNTLCNIAAVYYPDGSSCSTDENLITLDPESLKQAIQTNPHATGLITHSSVAQATEGACCLLLASQEFVNKYKLTPLAKLSAPVSSTTNQAVESSLNNSDLTVADIDYWEWEETSAAEVLAIKQKPLFQSLNSFDHVNLDGGSLALGRPYAAGQLRTLLQLSHTLNRNKGKYGLCHFGFLNKKSSAVLLESVEGVNS